MAAPAIRYPFTKTAYDLEQLQAELLDAGLPVVGTCGAGETVEVLVPEDAPDLRERCAVVVAGHVPRTAEQRLRAQALGALFASTDPVLLAIRHVVMDLYTAVNVVRVHVGLPKEFEPEIMARLVAGIAPPG